MKISFTKYPLDILICIVWSFLLLPLVLFKIGGVIQIVFGLVFTLFIPGYVLIFVLFPTRKTDKGIDTLQRIALSFGFSIAVVPLIAFGLNYTPWGVQLESITLFLTYFVLIFAVLGLYLWIKTPVEKRFILSIEVSFLKSEKKMDKVLTLLIGVSILIAALITVYAIITPKEGEHYTEFYLLTSDHKDEGYKKNFTIGEQTTGIIGVLNHEYQPINYTVEIWLIDQTTYENQTIYKHMWFIWKNWTKNPLPHTDINLEKQNISQWEFPYSYNISNITRVGSFKLTFLLFTHPTDQYPVDYDCKNSAAQKINSAYRELHLWINIF
jgi:uncharacterized membrane protein